MVGGPSTVDSGHWKGVPHLVCIIVTINTRYRITSREILSSFPEENSNCDQNIQAPLHCLYLVMIYEGSLDFTMHLI